LATFAFAEVAIGHLNLATAFLSSIVIGNGINFGIVLVARYQEAVRGGEHGVACIATTIRSTLAGTLAAALAASVAYGSLMLTVVSRVRDFGIIAGVGILPCWIAAYTVLPAVLAIAERVAAPGGARRASARAMDQQPRAATRPHAGGDPRPRDHRHGRDHVALPRRRSVRARLPEPAFAQRRDRRRGSVDGVGSMARSGQGISGGFVIAVADRSEIGPLVATLRAHDVGLPEAKRLFSRIESLDDLVPPDQAARLAMLGDLRELLTDKAIDELEPEDRDEARALRPPADLRPLRDDEVPEELAWPFHRGRWLARQARARDAGLGL